MDIASDQPVTGLAAAKKAAGNAKKLAALLGITPAAITKWGSEVPLKRLVEVETATGIPRYLLRPDLFAHSAPTKPKRAA